MVLKKPDTYKVDGACAISTLFVQSTQIYKNYSAFSRFPPSGNGASRETDAGTQNQTFPPIHRL